MVHPPTGNAERFGRPYTLSHRTLKKKAKGTGMLKSAVVGLVALSLMSGVASGQSPIDCGNAYKGVWDKLDRQKYAKISAEQLAGINRLSLRGYDACQAGDKQDGKLLFAKVAELTDDWGRESSTGPFNPNMPR
jgi:hypothetical protein